MFFFCFILLFPVFLSLSLFLSLRYEEQLQRMDRRRQEILDERNFNMRLAFERFCSAAVPGLWRVEVHRLVTWSVSPLVGSDLSMQNARFCEESGHQTAKATWRDRRVREVARWALFCCCCCCSHWKRIPILLGVWAAVKLTAIVFDRSPLGSASKIAHQGYASCRLPTGEGSLLAPL